MNRVYYYQYSFLCSLSQGICAFRRPQQNMQDHTKFKCFKSMKINLVKILHKQVEPFLKIERIITEGVRNLEYFGRFLN